MTRSLSLLATLVAGCATTPAGDAPDPTGPGGKGDGELTTITFADDWSETLDGELVAGSSIRIQYDLDRLTTCRGYTNGSEAWGVGGYAQFDDASPVPFSLSRIVDGEVVAVDAELEIPASAARVQFWFDQTDVFGCHAYDSNDSANYGWDVATNRGGAVLAFDADMTFSQSGAVHTGDNVVVHYEPSRLSACAGSSGGNAQWGITGYYQVDGGAVRALAVARANGPDLVPTDVTFAVPRGDDLALWFEASNRWGCHAYDSNGGANYHVTIE